jgi:hypothetical protein
MKQLLFDVREANKQYPCYVAVFREEDDQVSFIVRSTQRGEGIKVAGNSGCCCLNGAAVKKLIAALQAVVSP